ncbi:MAG TPA: cbb3-type cytochrome c oxidase subunit I [Anaerolineaceae bacterium]|nr:cbb3-type cytochrome c oxidase subunit I [Anaerolineaceae bacterium]
MRRFWSIGLVRGLVFQAIGTVFGVALLSLIRLLLGLPFALEPAVVLGAVTGAIGFMIGVGAFTDWFRMVLGRDVPHPAETHEEQTGRRYWGVSYDHKVIGVQYGALTIIAVFLGGMFALIFRTELAAPGIQIVSLQQFNTLIGLHGMVAIVGMLLGGAALGNYLVPLLIGAKDMAFPRLNAFAFWLAVPAVVLVLSSMVAGGFDTGWTGYPPLSIRAPLGMQLFFSGVAIFGWSSVLSALNIIATVLTMRAPGMSLFRMPIFVWGSLATSIIALTATQLIGLSFQMVMFERLFGMGFFDPAEGGNPILFQHLFWFYSHPAVYIFVLPGFGVISEILPVFTRKPLFGYKWVAMSSIGIALVGFLVWAHHMFTAGMEEFLRVPFMYSTLLVAIPTGIKFFSWTATLWEGKIRFSVPMLFVLGAINVFLLGGLTGPVLGTVPTDLHLHDSYFVVGHFHNTMFGGFIFPFIAAITYWFPKVTGRMMSDRLGRFTFFILLPAFWIQTLGQMQVGLLGMRRRIADYPTLPEFTNTHVFITIAGFLVGLSFLIFMFNVIYSAVRGRQAVGNVWESQSPEWQLLPNPAPEHNYAEPFVVVGDPYDYGLPGAEYIEQVPVRPAPTAAD